MRTGGTAARCPGCGGAVPPDAPWCTQCWRDLRPAPEPVPEVMVGPVPEAPVVPAPRTAEDALPSWPCSGCGSLSPIGLDACAGCGTAFLAGLREQGPHLVLPYVGDLARLGRSQRAVAAVGLVLLVALLTALAGAVLS